MTNILFPTQKVIISKKKENLEFELEQVFEESKEFSFYKELVSNRLIVKYKSNSFFKSFVSIKEVEIKGKQIYNQWNLRIMPLDEQKNIYLYFCLLFPIICVIMFFIFGGYKTIFVGILAGCLHFLIIALLRKSELLKWRRTFIDFSENL